jgi:hypothetical protein
VGVVTDIDPIDLGLLLAQLMEVDPSHELVLAARLALEIGDARRAAHRELREASLDVHSALSPAEWRLWAENHVPCEELQRRRAA